jgi:hypothetical protein
LPLISYEQAAKTAYAAGESVMARLFMVRYTFPMLVGAVTAAALTYMVMKPPQHRHAVTVVEPGVLYRSGQLDPEELEEEIRRRGIKTVVNLGSQTDWDRDVCRRLGVKLLDLPVGDVWCVAGEPAPGQETKPAAPFNLQPFWDLLEDPQAQPVLMHCWGGVHRTGVLTAMYRIRYQNWTANDAIAEMDLYGFESEKEKYAGVLSFLRTLQPGDRSAAHTADARGKRQGGDEADNNAPPDDSSSHGLDDDESPELPPHDDP